MRVALNTNCLSLRGDGRKGHARNQCGDKSSTTESMQMKHVCLKHLSDASCKLQGMCTRAQSKFWSGAGIAPRVRVNFKNRECTLLKFRWAILCISVIAAPLTPASVSAQGSVTDSIALTTVTVRVTYGEDRIASAVVRAGKIVGLTANDGTAILRLAAGQYALIVSRLGFLTDTIQLVITPLADTTIAVGLVPVATALATVTVAASRVERRVQEEPERVEVLSGEDIGEKSVMRPATSATLLSEMPGVRVQTTSPSTGGVGIRIQGLRGRYTQILADGLPLYGSASEGLGFLQIPPLDLAQAEVIKGAATALYGPAAAGGVVNLISRRPSRGGSPTREAMANVTSNHGADGLIWLGDSVSRDLDFTLLGGVHDQRAVDLNGDGWADVPGFKRIEVRPRLFWTNRNSRTAMLTAGGADEDRNSGFITSASPGAASAYRVTANTRRGDVGFVAHSVSSSRVISSIRSSVNEQWQDRRYGDSTERDHRGTALGEMTLSDSFGPHQVLIGAAAEYDGLSSNSLPYARYGFFTQSLFGQETFSPGEKFSASGAARLDHHSRYGTFLSLRISALFRLGQGWAARASAGRGFFAPTPLVEEAELTGLSRVRGFDDLKAEIVTQESADLTRTAGDLEITGTLFHSEIAHATVIREDLARSTITLLNAPVATRTSGASLYAVYNSDPVSITALYGYTRSKEWSADGNRLAEAELTPRQTAGLEFAFDADETGTRAGLEVFYTGRQTLRDNPYRNVSVPYTTLGILLEQKFGHVSAFLNAENLTGVRQTRFNPLLLPEPAIWKADYAGMGATGGADAECRDSGEFLIFEPVTLTSCCSSSRIVGQR